MCLQRNIHIMAQLVTLALYDRGSLPPPSNFSHTAYHRGVLVVPKEPGADSTLFVIKFMSDLGLHLR